MFELEDAENENEDLITEEMRRFIPQDFYFYYKTNKVSDKELKER